MEHTAIEIYRKWKLGLLNRHYDDGSGRVSYARMIKYKLELEELKKSIVTFRRHRESNMIPLEPSNHNQRGGILGSTEPTDVAFASSNNVPINAV
jgi:hypothetical protein